MKKLRVLIVDDSVVFRSQIRLALDAVPGIEVVGVAPNGKLALEKLQLVPTDVMTLDLEMPEMDGLETLREIKARGIKVKTIVFSSKTVTGAEASLQALSLGALDFVTKPGSEESRFASAQDAIQQVLVSKISALSGLGSSTEAASAAKPPKPAPEYRRINIEQMDPKVLLIGSSTGGPRVLEGLFAKLPAVPGFPILITQHMPPIFTASLASRIATLSGVPCAEAKHGEQILPGRIYVAPGDFHLTLANGISGKVIAQLSQDSQQNGVRPAVDPLFESAAKIYRSGCLAWVLTGMGSDGRRGACAVKAEGGAVAIQDRASSVVYGMPGSVEEAGAFDFVGTPAMLRRYLEEAIQRGTAFPRRIA